jgi:hypothetical protein
LKKETTKKRKFNVSSHKTLTVVQGWLTQDQEPDEKNAPLWLTFPSSFSQTHTSTDHS